MIKLSEEAKQAYSKYVGPDGRLIIDESLPEDMKETFKFFNDKGINILEMNINDESAESSNIELLDEDSDDVSEDILLEDNELDSSIDSESDIVEDNSNVDLDSLNKLFN